MGFLIRYWIHLFVLVLFRMFLILFLERLAKRCSLLPLKLYSLPLSFLTLINLFRVVSYLQRLVLLGLWLSIGFSILICCLHSYFLPLSCSLFPNPRLLITALFSLETIYVLYIRETSGVLALSPDRFPILIPSPSVMIRNIAGLAVLHKFSLVVRKFSPLPVFSDAVPS